MFKIVHPNASKIKRIVQAVFKLSDELPFYITRNGLDIKVLSPDKTVLAIASLSSLEFEEYNVEEETVVIVPTTDLRKVIKRATRNDSLSLSINKETNELIVSLKDRKTSMEREFTVPIIPKPPEPVPEIQLDLPVSFTMLSQDFKDIVGDLKTIGEEALFIYENGVIIIKSTEHQKEYSCTLREGAPLIMLSSAVDKARSSYNIEMIVAVARASGVAKNVSISFDTGKPMQVVYELTGGGRLTFWIVPRT